MPKVPIKRNEAGNVFHIAGPTTAKDRSIDNIWLYLGNNTGHRTQ